MREAGALLPGLPRPLEAPQGSIAADWVWRRKPRAVQQTSRELFAAQFVLGQAPGAPVVEEAAVAEMSINCGEPQAALPGGSTSEGGAACESIGRASEFQARLRGWLLGE